jgi:type IV pilus assembly protein PilQ
MRKQLLSAILPLLVLGLAASAAETPASQPAGQKNELQRVNVVRGTDEVRVEMSARGPVTPKVSTMDSPARLVVELPDTVMATGQSHIAVGGADVKDVRIGMDGLKPPTTRVVVDLDHACRYELNPSADGKLVLTLFTAPATAKADAPKVESVSAPALQNASSITPKVVEAKAEVAPTPAADATSKTPAATSDFVFVEPTYQAKPATADKTAADVKTADKTEDPDGRSQDAAAKFADKTVPELLPASFHAAQAPGAASNPNIQPAVNLAAEQKAQAGQQPAAMGPKYTGEPISVNLKDVDLKDFFRLIHEISGLNVVLDPNVHGTLTIVLDDVPWDQALDIVLKNNDLARELEGNVLRIATVDTLK